MSLDYSRRWLRMSVAKICQTLGWNGIQSTPLELLTDLLERYVLEVAKYTHRYAEQFGRTDPSLDDLGLAFHEMGINLAEMSDYVRNVDPMPLEAEVVKFPAPKQSKLNFPKPNSRELQEREEHVPDHLPPMYPELEEEVLPSTPLSARLSTSGLLGIPGESPGLPGIAGEKRPLVSPGDAQTPPSKKPRIVPEEYAHSSYQMKGVSMSPSGIPAPTPLVGTGKLPEPRTPPKFRHKSPPSPTVSPVLTPNVSNIANVSEIGMTSVSKSGDDITDFSPPNTPTGVSSKTLRPMVITETIEMRTTYGDFNSSCNKVGGKPSKMPGTPKSPRGGKEGAKSPRGAAASKSKLKAGGKPKSPKGGGKARSPSRAKSPKGSGRLKDLLLSDTLVNTPEKSDRISTIKDEPLSPQASPGFVTSTPLVDSKMQSRITSKIIDESSKGAEDSPEPVLVIDEAAAKQKEKLEAQKRRFAIYDDIMDSVLQSTDSEVKVESTDQEEDIMDEPTNVTSGDAAFSPNTTVKLSSKYESLIDEVLRQDSEVEIKEEDTREKSVFDFDEQETVVATTPSQLSLTSSLSSPKVEGKKKRGRKRKTKIGAKKQKPDLSINVNLDETEKLFAAAAEPTKKKKVPTATLR